MKKKRVEAVSACMPIETDIVDAAAMQALERGEADADQQKRILNWFINKAAMTYDMSYRPGDPHETTFAEGRRFCGLQAVKLLKVNIAALRKTGETR